MEGGYIDELVEKLRQVVKLNDDSTNENDDTIVDILDSLRDVIKTSIEGNLEFTVNDVFLVLLTQKSNVIIAKTAKLMAEIARTKEGRNSCTCNNLVKTLIVTLSNKEDIEILTQTSRALGNICYENASGSKMVEKNDGLQCIMEVFTSAINFKDTEGADFLRDVVAGFLLNFLVEDKALQQQALNQGLISIICDVLDVDTWSEKEVTMHLLLVLESINDNGIQFLDQRLVQKFIDILGKDDSTESSAICIELLYGQAEYENTKLLLAEAGICQLLIKLIEKHVFRCTDDESRSVLKMACNLIVLITTEDESMKLLYAEGNGIVYRKLVEWLESTVFDRDLQIAAVLAMSNFATTDTHCQALVNQGIHKKLFQLLQENNTTDGEVRFQHALLSAIRNLVISPVNKPIMLADGLMNVVYPMLDIPTFLVVFKLLGIFRIAIDNQQKAAIYLGTKENLVKKLIEWSSVEEHLGVQGEAGRLIASLVIQSHDKNVITLIIKHGAIEHLVKMILSPHQLIQHAGVLSLTLISAMSLDTCESELIKANIHEILKQFLENSINTQEPIIENTIAFIRVLINSAPLKKHLQQKPFLDVLNNCQNTESYTNTLRTKIQELIIHFKD